MWDADKAVLPKPYSGHFKSPNKMSGQWEGAEGVRAPKFGGAGPREQEGSLSAETIRLLPMNEQCSQAPWGF